MSKKHQDRIREQFTKQAAMFADAPQIQDEDALRALLELTEAGSDDTALDVACGPGIVTCAFGRVVAQATGMDVTPAMIEHARALQDEKRLANVSWRTGDVRRLPFDDRSFSIVTSRYAFHHLEEPQTVLAEMARVAVLGGKLAVVDVMASDEPEKAAAFNEMERLRDPSHVRARTLADLHGLFAAQGLSVSKTAFYLIDFEVDPLLERSFPADGDREKLRELYRDSLAGDSLGLRTREVDGTLVCTYPIAMLLAVC